MRSFKKDTLFVFLNAAMLALIAVVLTGIVFEDGQLSPNFLLNFAQVELWAAYLAVFIAAWMASIFALKAEWPTAAAGMLGVVAALTLATLQVLVIFVLIHMSRTVVSGNSAPLWPLFALYLALKVLVTSFVNKFSSPSNY